jgi:hypothetical protein
MPSVQFFLQSLRCNDRSSLLGLFLRCSLFVHPAFRLEKSSAFLGHESIGFRNWKSDDANDGSQCYSSPHSLSAVTDQDQKEAKENGCMSSMTQRCCRKSENALSKLTLCTTDMDAAQSTPTRHRLHFFFFLPNRHRSHITRQVAYVRLSCMSQPRKTDHVLNEESTRPQLFL